jgi:hypothetical protein
MPKDISSWAIRTKKGDIITRVRGNQSIVRWKDRHDVYVLTNMHTPPVEGNFCDESGRATKPRVIEDYNARMGYVDKLDRMVNSYGIARRTWKWTKKLFFHQTDMAILNASLLHKASGGKMTHKRFREVLVHNLIAESHEQNVTASSVSRGETESICIPNKSPGSDTFTTLALKRKAMSLPCVCNEEQKREHTVYLCEV